MILTHAHADHVGMAEGVRVDAPAPVYVHEADAEMARTGKVHKRDGSDAPLPAPPGASGSCSRSAPAPAALKHAERRAR